MKTELNLLFFFGLILIIVSCFMSKDTDTQRQRKYWVLWTGIFLCVLVVSWYILDEVNKRANKNLKGGKKYKHSEHNYYYDVNIPENFDHNKLYSEYKDPDWYKLTYVDDEILKPKKKYVINMDYLNDKGKFKARSLNGGTEN